MLAPVQKQGILHRPENMARLLLSLCSFFLITDCFAGDRGVPPSCGILNFGRVDERVYRGAQPDKSALAGLKQLGVKTIINLRMAHDVLVEEPLQALADSMVYTNVPMTGIGRPSDEQINHILSLIE